MKKILALVLAAAMLFMAFAFAGCGNTEAEAEATTKLTANGETAAAAQKLIVGFDAEFPPFGFISTDGDPVYDKYDGFDLAMAKELCKRLGWEFEAKAIDWDSKDAELKSGSINCIWNGFTYTGRENQYEWSEPYYDNRIVAVVKADSGIKTLADLAGKTIMAQAASSAVEAVEGNEAFNSSLKEMIELPDYNTGFMELNQGTVDAVAADLGVANFQIANNSGSYIILDEPISSEQYAIGFLKGNTELRNAVNAELLKMAEDGTMMEIAKGYEEAGLTAAALCLCK